MKGRKDYSNISNLIDDRKDNLMEQWEDIGKTLRTIDENTSKIESSSKINMLKLKNIALIGQPPVSLSKDYRS